MSILTKRINEGLEGKYKGLSNGFDTLNKYIFGIQRNTYYLIGGSSGTYKTTLLDYMVRNAIKDANDNNIKCNVFYYSFEIDKITKMCNWTSGIIYQLYGVVIPPEKSTLTTRTMEARAAITRSAGRDWRGSSNPASST